uniref:Plastid-encoded RNA polymerase subunit alpha n=1 Tax=Euglena archaeoplastidiata TaxID=1188008 RepID=A0A1X9GCN8_9EUGL|nr:RNA polymerase alpha subunit [Euglena archaeoplastidiata]AKR17900.1 RNA polymerase alpha subunit [Euglena archaeoplastidiata]
MKLTKLTIKNFKNFEKNNYTLFQLKTIDTDNAQIIGNKIRRNLLKETVSFKFKDIAIFVSNEKNNRKYNYINEFINMEEIKEATSDIINNFKQLLFKSYKKLINNNSIIKIDLNNISEVTSQNIKIPKFLKTKIVQSKFHLFNVISKKIKIKVLLKIGIRF